MKKPVLTTEATDSNPRERLQILDKSLQEGLISKEEYDKEKEKLQPELEEWDKKAQDKQEDVSEQPKTADKSLIIGLAVILVLFIGVIAYAIINKPQPKTVEELHVLNLKGKLKPEQGYIYKKVYSFVTLDNLWYTQLTSPKGTRLYNMAMRYSPQDVQGMQITGNLDDDFFNNQTIFYNTFDPTGNQLQYVSLAVADFSTHLTRVFDKMPMGACDRNITSCNERPIVTCDDKDKLVLYIKESEQPKISYDNNCIIVEGSKFDLVKGVDKVLYNLYGIMGKNE